MIRRSFRIGIRVGLLAGVVFALYKLAQARRVAEPLPATEPRRPDPWPPVAAPDVEPPVAAPEPQPAPAAETPAPIVETPPPPPPAPVEEAVKKAAGAVKKAAPKTQKATKKAATKKKAATTRAWVAPQGAVCPLSHPIKAKMSSRMYHLPGMLAYTRTKPDRCYANETAAKRDGFSPAKR